MPGATREIRRRIRSVTNTRKVTKAMELVASAKMRRAVQAVLSTRAYASSAWELLTAVAERTERESHPLLRGIRSDDLKSAGGRIAVAFISSNRGLVGGFNAQLVAATAGYLRERVDSNSPAPEIVLLGKKGRAIVYKYGYTAVAEFEKLDVVTRVNEIRPLAKLIIDDFRAGKYDRIVLAYTNFVSTLVQKPRVRQLLPLQRSDAREMATQARELGQEDRILKIGSDDPRSDDPAQTSNAHHELEYVFEPNAGTVLEVLLQRLVEMQLYQAVLESNASEHAARMVTMRNASDAAGDLIDDLTLTFNQARQAGITQDLSEISASRTALEE